MTPDRKPRRRRRAGWRALLAAGLAAAALAGCETQVDVRGNLPDPKVVAQIQPGKQTREQVEKMLGTPSTVATFDKEIWYYVGGRTKTTAFFKPEVLERKVITIRFDKRGVVEEVKQVDATKGPKVRLVKRETPTKGKELTFLQQIIGNIGRFGQPKAADNGL